MHEQNKHTKQKIHFKILSKYPNYLCKHIRNTHPLKPTVTVAPNHEWIVLSPAHPFWNFTRLCSLNSSPCIRHGCKQWNTKLHRILSTFLMFIPNSSWTSSIGREHSFHKNAFFRFACWWAGDFAICLFNFAGLSIKYIYKMTIFCAFVR